MTLLARRGLKLPRFLALGSAILLLVIASEWLFVSHVGSDSGTAPRAAAARAGDSGAARIAQPSFDSYNEIAARPLFVQDRKPQPPDKAASGPPPARPNVTVVGIVLTGSTHYAMIRHGNPPKLEALAEGQTVDGWKIETIASDRVSLSSGATSVDYMLGGKPAPGQEGGWKGFGGG